MDTLGLLVPPGRLIYPLQKPTMICSCLDFSWLAKPSQRLARKIYHDGFEPASVVTTSAHLFLLVLAPRLMHHRASPSACFYGKLQISMRRGRPLTPSFDTSSTRLARVATACTAHRQFNSSSLDQISSLPPSPTHCLAANACAKRLCRRTRDRSPPHSAPERCVIHHRRDDRTHAVTRHNGFSRWRREYFGI